MTFEILFIILIVVLQSIAIYLDNQGVFHLIENYKDENLAGLYAKKHQIDFLSRGFLFFTPPLLGYLIVQNDLNYVLYIFLLSALLSLFITCYQCIKLNRKLNLPLSKKFTLNKFMLIILGILVYSIYLYVPFYLNILAYFFKDQSLWLVQFSPALTVITSIFVVYYMDPRIAKFIDAKDDKRNSEVVFDLIMMRISGRIFIVLIAILFLVFFSSNI
jgi:hypothetical protein